MISILKKYKNGFLVKVGNGQMDKKLLNIIMIPYNIFTYSESFCIASDEFVADQATNGEFICDLEFRL